MPTYDYRCKKCEDRFEHLQSIMSDPLTICKKCEGELVRLVGKGAGIIFKGTGFYETDYKNKE
jgi:putative FmdB family regulatory protein